MPIARETSASGVSSFLSARWRAFARDSFFFLSPRSCSSAALLRKEGANIAHFRFSSYTVDGREINLHALCLFSRVIYLFFLPPFFGNLNQFVLSFAAFEFQRNGNLLCFFLFFLMGKDMGLALVSRLTPIFAVLNFLLSFCIFAIPRRSIIMRTRQSKIYIPFAEH